MTNLRIQVVAVVIGFALMLGKFIAFYITNSNAIFTDAAESIINVVAGCFAMYSVYLAAKPKDKDHPYGHGKIEFIAAGFEGALIFLAGTVIIFKSIYNLFSPATISQLDVGMYLVIGAGIVNFFLGKWMLHKGTQQQSLTIIAEGKHLLTDAYSTVGLVIGLVLIYFTSWMWLDSVVAILFGGLIIYTGFQLLRESVAGIMDETDEKLVAEVIEVLNKNRRPEWIDIHNLRIIRYGNTLHIDCHLTVPWYFNVQQAHQEVDDVDEIVNTHGESQIEFFIHTDPCLPSSCGVCSKMDCKVRKFPLKKRVEWDLENVMMNKRHGKEVV